MTTVSPAYKPLISLQGAVPGALLMATSETDGREVLIVRASLPDQNGRGTNSIAFDEGQPPRAIANVANDWLVDISEMAFVEPHYGSRKIIRDWPPSGALTHDATGALRFCFRGGGLEGLVGDDGTLEEIGSGPRLIFLTWRVLMKRPDRKPKQIFRWSAESIRAT